MSTFTVRENPMLKVGDTIQFETSIGIIHGTVVPAYECDQDESGNFTKKEHTDAFCVNFDEKNSDLLNELYDWHSAVILLSKPEWIQIGLSDGAYGGPEYRIEPCIIKKPDENLSQPPAMPNWNLNPGFLSQWAKKCLFGDGPVQFTYDGFKITREGDFIKLSLLNDGDEWAYILLPFEPIAEGGSVTILGQPGLTSIADGTITVNID